MDDPYTSLAQCFLIEAAQMLDFEHTVVVFPGRFQPFHGGHASVYTTLLQKFPHARIAITTSNNTDNDNSPFTFNEKIVMANVAGVPSQAFVLEQSPYKPVNTLQGLPESTTLLVVAISEKDMEVNPRFSFAPKKDGSPSYFQPFDKHQHNLEPLVTHGYIVTFPTVSFKLLGSTATNASEIRQAFREGDDQDRQQILTDLYGVVTPELYRLFEARLLHQTSPV